jgi:hypothetical protein
MTREKIPVVEPCPVTTLLCESAGHIRRRKDGIVIFELCETVVMEGLSEYRVQARIAMSSPDLARLARQLLVAAEGREILSIAEDYTSPAISSVQ